MRGTREGDSKRGRPREKAKIEGLREYQTNQKNPWLKWQGYIYIYRNERVGKGIP